MFELDIEVLWHSDGTRILEDAGMDFNPDDLENRTVTFYHIDCISPCRWDESHSFCNIHAGGEKWIAPYTYDQIKQMISEARNK